MDKFDFNQQFTGAINPDRPSPQSDFKSADKESNESEVITKKDVQAFIENSKLVTDTVDNFCAVMLTPDGHPVDFSDKEGRALLQQGIAANTRVLGEGKTAIEKAGTAVLQKIPSKVDAEFGEEDRKRLDKSFEWYKGWVITLVIVGFAVGVLLTGGIYVNVKASNRYDELSARADSLEQRSKELDRKTADQQESIDFGNYMKQMNPKTLSKWRASK